METGFTDPQAPAATKKYPTKAVLGSTGLRQYSGYVREEFLRELQGMRAANIYQEMAANDATVGSILYAIRNTLRGVKWEAVSAAPGEKRADEAAEMVHTMLHEDMQYTWPEFIDMATGMFTYGYSMFEVLWKKRDGWKPEAWLASDFNDGLWGIRALAPRGQRTITRWIFDDEENILGFEQWPDNRPMTVIPMSRCLHFRTTTDLNNPEGASTLRTAYRSWYFLKRLQEIEAVGTERDLVGYPVLRVPGEMLSPDATSDQINSRNAFETMLKEIRRDTREGVMLPSETDEKGHPYFDFELMSSGGSRQIDIDKSINRYERRIAMTVLADFVFLGTDGAGSLALADSKTNMFASALGAYLAAIAAEINEKLIPMIWRMNGLDFDIIPKMVPGDIGNRDLTALGNYVKNLYSVGYDLGTDVELENALRAAANLPLAPDREVLYEELGLPPTGMAQLPTPPVDPNEDPATVADSGSADGPSAQGKAPAKAKGDAEGDGVTKGFDMSAVLRGMESYAEGR